MSRTIQKTGKQQGFTLIEIAIVLVIIGLLVGGVLQGQELIENSRVKQAIKDMNGTSAALFAYQDRYGRIPGDDGDQTALQARGSTWAGVTAGNANGNLEVNVGQAFGTSGTEGIAFWQHLKAAGFISGSPVDAGILALPTNAWGGLIGVLADNMGGGLAGNKVCLSQVPGKAAIAIDSQLDDSLGVSGRVRATLGAGGRNTNPSNRTLAAPYSEDSVYTVCYRM